MQQASQDTYNLKEISIAVITPGIGGLGVVVIECHNTLVATCI